MRPKVSRLVVLVSFAVCLLISSALAIPIQDRIAQPISNTNRVTLKGNVHPLARSATDLGLVNGTMTLERMKLVFSPTPAQQKALDTLLAQQQDPHSPNYHKWLTPEQFADRFGLSKSDFNKVATWLRSQGFTVVDAARGRTYIGFNGTANQVEAAFRTPIHNFSVNGRVHYANTAEPAIPSALEGVVTGVAALNNFQPKPRLVKPLPRVTSSYSGNHFMQPGDFATIYNLTGLYNSGIDGTGQTIAVMAQTDLVADSSGNFTDVATFRSNSGLSAPKVNTVLIPGATDPGVVSGDIDEANLDVEWAGGIAKNATILYVIGNGTTGQGTFDSLQYAVNNNVAPVISISYGLCEQQLDSATKTALTNAGVQANAQGQTIVAPSGDGGAADCDTGSSATHGLAVDFPASMPYATSAGGSEFTGNPPGSDVAGTVTTDANGNKTAAATQYWSGSSSLSDTSPTALSYIPETVWNDTATDQTLAAGGGGLSTLFTQPTWQSGLSVITNGMRGVPDISVSASADHDGYLICSQGSCSCGFRNSCSVSGNLGTFDPSGGTSAAVPAFAAIVTLINEETNDRQGNVNPVLYSLFVSAPNAFHDITTGNNIVPCTIGTTDCPQSSGGQIGYSAAVGYDLASGLGSFDAGALVAAWNGPSTPGIQLGASSPSMSVAAGATATNSITVVPVGGLSGTINLSCSVSTTLVNVACSVNPTSLTSQGSVVLTVDATTMTLSASGTVTVNASSGSVSQSLAIPVTIAGGDFALTVNPTSLTISSGSTGTASIASTVAGGFDGPIAFTCSVSSSLGATTCSLNPTSVTSAGSTTLTIHAATLTSSLHKRERSFPGSFGLESTFAVAALLLVPRRKRQGRGFLRRYGIQSFLCLVALASILGITSCGGGGSSNNGGGSQVTPISGTVTVTGTSGSLSHSVQVTVTVD